MDVSSQPAASRNSSTSRRLSWPATAGTTQARRLGEHREPELVSFRRQMLATCLPGAPCPIDSAIVAGVAWNTWNFAWSIQLSNRVPQWSKLMSFD